MQRNYLLLQRCGISSLRNCTRLRMTTTNDAPIEVKTCNKFDPIFSKEIAARQNEAKRSVLVAVDDKQAAQSLYSYAKKFGTVQACYLYSTSSRQRSVLIEYDEYSSVEKLLSNCNFQDGHNVIPISSIFLLFKPKLTAHLDSESLVEEALVSPSVFNELMQSNSLSEQIKILYSYQKGTDLESRMRFIICHQLEKTLTGIFPFCKVLPFGSSVNGFGRRNCDLDMILQLQSEEKQNANSELFFQSMPPLNNRMLVQRSLDTLGGIFHDFVPGCLRVQRILHARVPILKFHHQFTDVDCDVTLSNLSGYHMSELLNIFSQCDSRVPLLVHTVREWAQVNHLTNSSPGRWITNFSLLLMVIFFFQRRPNPVLPSFDKLKNSAGKKDRKKAEGVDCTYLRDVSKIPKTSNTENIGDILKEFFAYYANFNFKSHGISICSGEEIVKPNYDALYIENPLENLLNVSKNISLSEITRLKTCMQTSLWKLETYSEPNVKVMWGLCKILDGTESSMNGSVKNYGFALDNLFASKKNNVNSTVDAESAELDTYVDSVVETTIRSHHGIRSKNKQATHTETKSMFSSSSNK